MSVTAAGGFLVSASASGLKDSGEDDVMVLLNTGPSKSGAAVFTTNACLANPVLWSKQAVSDGQVSAIVINSGGANCFTGHEGFQTTHEMAETVAQLCGISASDVLVGSTGIIGHKLDRVKVLSGIRACVSDLSAAASSSDASAHRAARAIMTTDSVPKQVTVVSDSGWTIGAMAKGAGMLAPGLATMLAVITTDALVEAPVLLEVLRKATSRSFDRFDSDGCMSTNDMVVLCASGASGIVPDAREFEQKVQHVCFSLMQQMVADAEGSSHDIAIEVANAANEQDALTVARSIARSALFKAAVYGGDPNWGRVLAAVGTSGAVFDPSDISIAINGVTLCCDGHMVDTHEQVDLSGRHVDVTVSLGSGGSAATVWTNDLTPQYVTLNGHYST